MPKRDIVVIGASIGGVAALTTLVGGLPPDFPAAVFVVLHVMPDADSRLPEILARATPLPVAHAQDGDPIRAGTITVAPPDHHLLIRSGHVEVSRGPRENRARPAVDPLFRSAARVYGRRVVGVILTGALSDGSAGLLAVASRGGATIVQDPEEAEADGMPRSALRLTDADHVVPVAAMASLIDRIVREVEPAGTSKNGASQNGAPHDREDDPEDVADDPDEHLAAVIEQLFAEQVDPQRPDGATIFVCPDCGGVLFQEGAPVTRYRCHVGHAYAPELLLDLKHEQLEAALWTCVRMLTEKATLARQVAGRTGRLRGVAVEGRLEEQATADEQQARLIRDLLAAMPGPSGTVARVVNNSGG